MYFYQAHVTCLHGIQPWTPRRIARLAKSGSSSAAEFSLALIVSNKRARASTHTRTHLNTRAHTQTYLNEFVMNYEITLCFNCINTFNNLESRARVDTTYRQTSLQRHAEDSADNLAQHRTLNDFVSSITGHQRHPLRVIHGIGIEIPQRVCSNGRSSLAAHLHKGHAQAHTHTKTSTCSCSTTLLWVHDQSMFQRH